MTRIELKTVYKIITNMTLTNLNYLKNKIKYS